MEKKKYRTSFVLSLAIVIFTQKSTRTSKEECQTKLMDSSSELAQSPPLSSPRGEVLHLFHRGNKE